MTEKKRTLRPRRRTAGNDIPKDLADWFAGEPRPEGRSLPWASLIYPDYMFFA